MDKDLKKVVVLLAHPNMENSQANKALLDAIKDIEDVAIFNLYEMLEQDILNMDAWSRIISHANAVVYQFPFYWMSAPSLLKKWQDGIFTYLAKTPAVAGKPLLVVTTTGSEFEAYRSGRRNRSRAPFVIGVIILLVVIVAGGIFAGRKYMAYRQQKAEEARKLAEARRVVTVMIPEGYSIDMIAKRLEKQGVFKADEFIKAAKNTDQYKNDFIKDIDPKKGTKYKLEGYLYPDTYKIYKSSKPEDLIQKMLDNFDKKYSALAKSYKGKRSMAEIMTIASMIEREASNMSERPMIAGVIENRLAAKMRLQIDPTVLYTTTNGLYNAKKVYYKDLKVKTVYNTYVMKGLPAGPICNPSDTAIKAAMHPKKHDYLYYRTDGSKKGTHVFTKTFDEHKNAKSTSTKDKNSTNSTNTTNSKS